MVLRLTMKTGRVNIHAVAVDANRAIICFGPGDDGVQRTFAISEADRQDTATAKTNLLQHFNNLQDITVHSVRRVMLKNRKQLVKVPHAAIKIVDGVIVD